MRHKVRDLGVFFCFALMLFTVTSCGKADIVAAQEKLSANSVAVHMESRV